MVSGLAPVFWSHDDAVRLTEVLSLSVSASADYVLQGVYKIKGRHEFVSVKGSQGKLPGLHQSQRDLQDRRGLQRRQHHRSH